MKFALRNLTFFNFIRMDAGLSEYRNSLLYCVKTALVDAQNFLRIASAFEVCGMWPWNPSRVLSDSTKVTPSLVVPTTATATQSITGRVFTSGMIAASRLRREENGSWQDSSNWRKFPRKKTVLERERRKGLPRPQLGPSGRPVPQRAKKKRLRGYCPSGNL